MPSNTFTIENAQLIFKNFSGAPDKFDKVGSPNFHIRVDETLADELRGLGLNVKPLRTHPDDPDDEQFYHIKVKMNFDSRRPPRVVLVTDDGIKSRRQELDKDTVRILDGAHITLADLTLNLYEWEVNGQTGVTPYLQTLYATIELDPIEAKYMSQED